MIQKAHNGYVGIAVVKQINSKSKCRFPGVL